MTYTLVINTDHPDAERILRDYTLKLAVDLDTDLRRVEGTLSFAPRNTVVTLTQELAILGTRVLVHHEFEAIELVDAHDQTRGVLAYLADLDRQIQGG